MYIALQKVKNPRILLSNDLERMHRRLREDGIPASIIHQDETGVLKHVQEYTPLERR